MPSPFRHPATIASIPHASRGLASQRALEASEALAAVAERNKASVVTIAYSSSEAGELLATLPMVNTDIGYLHSLNVKAPKEALLSALSAILRQTVPGQVQAGELTLDVQSLTITNRFDVIGPDMRTRSVMHVVGSDLLPLRSDMDRVNLPMLLGAVQKALAPLGPKASLFYKMSPENWAWNVVVDDNRASPLKSVATVSALLQQTIEAQYVDGKDKRQWLIASAPVPAGEAICDLLVAVARMTGSPEGDFEIELCLESGEVVRRELADGNWTTRYSFTSDMGYVIRDVEAARLPEADVSTTREEASLEPLQLEVLKAYGENVGGAPKPGDEASDPLLAFMLSEASSAIECEGPGHLAQRLNNAIDQLASVRDHMEQLERAQQAARANPRARG